MSAAHAADFAPAGAKATLTVDYVYRVDRQETQRKAMYDPYEWQVKRSVEPGG